MTHRDPARERERQRQKSARYRAADPEAYRKRMNKIMRVTRRRQREHKMAVVKCRPINITFD